MTSSTQIAKDHIKAAKRAMKKALRSKATARAFLVRAGISTKSGKLTKPYR